MFNYQEQWRSMVARSFSPSQWFEDGTRPGVDETHFVESIMWVYRKTEANLWTVGFYTPKGEWQSEGDYPSKTEAAERVHYLNGGGSSQQSEVARAARRGFSG